MVDTDTRYMSNDAEKGRLRLSFVVKILSTGIQAAVGIVTPLLLLNSGDSAFFNSYIIILTLSSFYGIIEGSIIWQTFNSLHTAVQDGDSANYWCILHKSALLTFWLTALLSCLFILILYVDTQLIYKDFVSNKVALFSFFLLSCSLNSLGAIFLQGFIANNSQFYFDIVSLLRLIMNAGGAFATYYTGNSDVLIMCFSASNILWFILLGEVHRQVAPNFHFDWRQIQQIKIELNSIKWTSLIITSQVAHNSATVFIAGKFLSLTEFAAFNVLFKIGDILLQASRKLLEANQYAIKNAEQSPRKKRTLVYRELISLTDQAGVLLFVIVAIFSIKFAGALISFGEHVNFNLLLPYLLIGLLWNPIAHLSHMIAVTSHQYRTLAMVYLLGGIAIVINDLAVAAYLEFPGLLFAKFLLYVFVIGPLLCLSFAVYSNNALGNLRACVARYFWLATIYTVIALFSQMIESKTIAYVCILLVYLFSQITIFRDVNLLVWLLKKRAG